MAKSWPFVLSEYLPHLPLLLLAYQKHAENNMGVRICQIGRGEEGYIAPARILSNTVPGINLQNQQLTQYPKN